MLAPICASAAFDSNRATDCDLGDSKQATSLTGPDRIAYQGAAEVPAQTYVDVMARHHFELPVTSPAHALEMRLGIQNLFDEDPPIVAEPNHLGYEYYGDPRGRRFEIQVTAVF